jgi:hypothetical protein
MSNVCGISNRTIAYVRRVYSMRTSHNSQSLIDRPPDCPKCALSSLCAILRHSKTTSARLDFNPATCAFAHNDAAIDKQSTLTTELGLVAQAAKKRAEVCDSQVAHVNGMCGSMMCCCRERSDIWLRYNVQDGYGRCLIVGGGFRANLLLDELKLLPSRIIFGLCLIFR